MDRAPTSPSEQRDPDPVTVTIAAIAMLASVGSLVINFQNQAERRLREGREDAVARRQLLTALRKLHRSCSSVENALGELARIVENYSQPYDARGRRPFAPAQRMLLPPSAASTFFQLTDRIARAISAANKSVADILDGMDRVGYNGRSVNELIEQNSVLTDVLEQQPPIEEALRRVRDVAASMKETLRNIEREIATA